MDLGLIVYALNLASIYALMAIGVNTGLALALFPVGLAFFTWDIGVKRGDIQVLGAAAYSAPLLSTLLLIAFGFGALTPCVVFRCHGRFLLSYPVRDRFVRSSHSVGR